MELAEIENIIDDARVQSTLQELVDVGLLRFDGALYRGIEGLAWEDFSQFTDKIKMKILLQFAENPKVNFLIRNTQQGKTKHIKDDILQATASRKLVVFVMTKNDKEVGKQTGDALSSPAVEIFSLCSDTTVTEKSIEAHIGAYAFGDPSHARAPVVVALANPKQWSKVMRLMHGINLRASRGEPLRFAIYFDEADQTYPPFRDKEVGEAKFSNFLKTKTDGLHRVSFVTATDGDLIESGDFPECANAFMRTAPPDDFERQNYRALHHPDSVRHTITLAQTNNEYALLVLESHDEHFRTPVDTPSGKYHRKIIAITNVRTKDMTAFALKMVANDMHAMILNGFGLTVHKGSEKLNFKLKGHDFKEMLFYFVKKLELEDKPLVILGCKKIDRGTTFHFAPRSAHRDIAGPLGLLRSLGMDGLIWTDLILGRVLGDATAIQKAGRGAGNIAHCPQFSPTHYWLCEKTADVIKTHNEGVDFINQEFDVGSALQAKTTNVRAIASQHKRVPYIYRFEPADKPELMGDRAAKDGCIRRLVRALPGVDPQLLHMMESTQAVQVTIPALDASYKLRVTDNVSASERDTPKGIMTTQEKRESAWEVFIDLRESRICVLWQIVE